MDDGKVVDRMVEMSVESLDPETFKDLMWACKILKTNRRLIYSKETYKLIEDYCSFQEDK